MSEDVTHHTSYVDASTAGGILSVAHLVVGSTDHHNGNKSASTNKLIILTDVRVDSST